MKITRFDETPNPNAVKAEVDSVLAEQPRPLYAIPDPGTDSLGHALMSIPGVRHVLIGGTWFTINKHEGFSWKQIKEAARRAVEKL